jgi:hypothetical protein
MYYTKYSVGTEERRKTSALKTEEIGRKNLA